jgi:hypothetical protein
MATKKSIYSPLADPNSILGPNFLQKTGRAIGGAVEGAVNAFSDFQKGGLIRSGRPRPTEQATPPTTVLPSGTPMVGFDSYPTRPTMPPSGPTQFPYGSALGPSIYSQTPTQTNLQTGMGDSARTPSSFSNINPPTFPQGAESISRLGIMGGVLSGGAVGPLPIEQMTPMPAGQRPIIDSGPVGMGITGTQTPEQRGLTPTQTPYGTVYGSPSQTASFGERATAYDSGRTRSPEQQQAALDRIRQNAPALNQQRTDWVMNTIQQRRDNPTTYTTPSGMSSAVSTNRFGEPLKAQMDQFSDGRLNYGPRPAPQTASASARQRNRGVGVAPNPSRPIPMPVDAFGNRIGVTGDYPFNPYESSINSFPFGSGI